MASQVICRRKLRKGARNRFWDWVEELPPPTTSSGRTNTDQLPVHHTQTDTKQTLASDEQQSDIVSLHPLSSPQTPPNFHSSFLNMGPILSITQAALSPPPPPEAGRSCMLPVLSTISMTRLWCGVLQNADAPDVKQVNGESKEPDGTYTPTHSLVENTEQNDDVALHAVQVGAVPPSTS
jgi:hypothetical protein